MKVGVSMLTMIKNTLKQHINQKFVLSISGGVDSMVLLDLMIKADFDIVVVHFNHNKRAASIDEAAYIKNYCLKNHIDYEYFILDFTSDNFHDQAHQLRKQHLIDVAKKYNTNLIVTGHHLNDLAETILMKLSRGSNIAGYAGMNQSIEKDGFYYLKPLLDTSKQALYQYAKEHQVYYFEDDSNTSNDYTRNRFRHNIMPELERENPQFLDKVSQYSQMLFEASDFIKQNAVNYITSHTKIHMDTFKALHPIIQKEVVSLLLKDFDIEQTNQKINGLVTFLLNAGPNQSYQLNEQYVFQKNYKHAFIKTKNEPVSFNVKLDIDAFNVLPNMGYITFLNSQFNSSNYEINLCYNKIALPLWARTRKNGDTLVFSYGKKKLKDFYIDKKIPKHLRDSDIIITDNDGQILAVLGRYYNQLASNTNKISLVYKRGI